MTSVSAAISALQRAVCSQWPNKSVDVHKTHTVWSAVYLTSWKSTPNIVCRSCGTKAQLLALLSSTLLGWWGFPWGVFVTPVQIGRNIAGLLRKPDPYSPSEELLRLARLQLGGELLNKQPNLLSL